MPPRILLTPGPSLPAPSVLAAMAAPLMGPMDTALFPILDEIVSGLRQTFQTANEVTFPISGTGTAGSEAAFANTVSPGTRVLIASSGYFADRMAEVARRAGAEVTVVAAPWGHIVDPADVERALRLTPHQIVGFVHVETSTGVCQPCPDLVRLAHNRDALVVVDAVASLAGIDLPTDRWEIDVCYSGSQKCLSAPPGLAPLTVSARARSQARSTKPSFYFDLELLWQYWGPTRAYHHTVPVPLLYALREALHLVQNEGLVARFERHRRHATALCAGLEALGLKLFVPEAQRSPTVTTVRVPKGVDDGRVRRRLLDEYDIDIAGGLGPLRGQIWRVGMMGYTAQARFVVALLQALEAILPSEQFHVEPGAAVRAASQILQVTSVA